MTSPAGEKITLDKLLSDCGPNLALIIKLAYALGYGHADNGITEQLPADDPAWKIVEAQRG